MTHMIASLLIVLSPSSAALGSAILERQGIGEGFFDVDLEAPIIVLLTHDGARIF